MRNTYLKLSNSMCMLFSIFLFNSCSNDTKTLPKRYTVEISQMKFQPAELLVQKGDTVVFINRDFVIHDVTEETNESWTSSALPAGKSWSLVVTQSSNYYCSIHQVMKGKLVVQ
jgi:plastocyanin